MASLTLLMTTPEQPIDSVGEGNPEYQPLAIPIRSTDSHNHPGQVSEEGFLDALYRGEFTQCVQSNFQYTREKRYGIPDVTNHLPPCQVVRAVDNAARLNFLLRGNGWWASFNIYDKRVWVDIGCDSLEQGHDFVKRLRDGLESHPSEEEIVKFAVWSSSTTPTTLRFPNVTWDSVAENYPSPTRTCLAELAMLTPAKALDNGKIIIFHGRPGTGKTWAIRSLLTSWKQWTEPIVLVDPEEMLSSAEYFLSVMEGVSKGAVRVVIIEDADQIVEKDGTRSADLSRMLNLTDGLIGASSDLIVLLSTNASPGQLDPALLRPGRCLATVNFEPFPAHEASLRIGKTVSSALTLAQIYEAVGCVEQVANARHDSIGQYL